MSDFENQVLSDLAVLKSQMRELLGNGQPGRLRQLEQRVERHERVVQRLSGVGALLAFLLALLHASADVLKFKPR
jgi:hypothetical protein